MHMVHNMKNMNFSKSWSYGLISPLCFLCPLLLITAQIHTYILTIYSVLGMSSYIQTGLQNLNNSAVHHMGIE